MGLLGLVLRCMEPWYLGMEHEVWRMKTMGNGINLEVK